LFQSDIDHFSREYNQYRSELLRRLLKIKQYNLPNTVTSIGCSAFAGCSGLTEITIPNSVTSIKNGAFFNCTGLATITIPSSVTSVESSVFYNCTHLNSIKFMSAATTISANADVIPTSTVIYGYTGSTAESYAIHITGLSFL
jgi:hypothetical protein